MEFKIIWLLLISGITAIAGLLGFSHKILRQKMMELESHLFSKITPEQARTLIADKLEVHKLEYRVLNSRIEELKKEYEILNHKMDRIISICSRLENGRKNS